MTTKTTASGEGTTNIASNPDAPQTKTAATFTDAEYIQALQRRGIPGSAKETIAHNDRLEAIAKRLEELDVKIMNDCGGYVP